MAAPPTRLVADRFGRSGRRWRGPSLFGFGFGIGNYYSDRASGYYQFDPDAFSGYPYDPYQFGRFEAPDLLDDPYFRERHRYDSHFKSPLILRGSNPDWTHRRHGGTTSPRHPHHAVPQHAVPQHGHSQHPRQLQQACQQLLQSLAAHEDGEAWVEFLAPNRIADWVAAGDTEALREILTHYDGIVANPEFRPITSARGFASTRTWLRRLVGTGPVPGVEIMPAPSRDVESTPGVETLPAPRPLPDGGEAPEPVQDGGTSVPAGAIGV